MVDPLMKSMSSTPVRTQCSDQDFGISSNLSSLRYDTVCRICLVFVKVNAKKRIPGISGSESPTTMPSEWHNVTLLVLLWTRYCILDLVTLHVKISTASET
jgi:hypothetical protein